MKKLVFLSFAAVSAMFIGCSDLEEHDRAAVKSNTISAVMEVTATRTSVTDEGNFTWASGDKIWLETTKGSVIGTLSDGEGTPNADFSYDSFIGEMTGNAVYPYNSGHSISGDALNVVLPSSYDLGAALSNTNAAMYGENVSGTLRFNHLAGVMRFAFKNVPAGVDRFTVTLDKKISGIFTADLTKEFPVIESSATDVESEKTVTLNFDALEATSDIKLYVPLPLGEYASLILELFKGEDSVWDYSNTVTNTVNRKSLILMPVVTLSGSIGGDIEGGDDTPSSPSEPQEGDYVDEYGINHGQGVAMPDGTIWAPVNCGYHAELHQYGKFYQYGRKYGVGLPDGSYPEYVEGKVSLSVGQSSDNADKLYRTDAKHASDSDWLESGCANLWNSTMDGVRVKAEYDPCPAGWRVASYNEWRALESDYIGTDTDMHGHECRYYINCNMAIELPNPPKILIPQKYTPYWFASYRGYYWCAESASEYGVCAQPLDNEIGFSNALLVRCVRDK